MTKKDFKEAIKQTLKQIPEDYTKTVIKMPKKCCRKSYSDIFE